MILSELTRLVSAQHGVFYTLTEPADGGEPVLQFQAGFGFKARKHLANEFRLGEGLVGQCALEKERILLTEVPSDYIQISSGLGESTPLNIIVLPILFEGSVRAVIELASFTAFSATHQSLLDQLTESIGLVLNTVAATSVTDKLLEQSLSQAQELQSRQEQLHQSNEELAEQATLLADKNSEVEGKYAEVEEAKRFVEEKARELAVSSKYKSEFIANMSHELRTPLNSLLVLAEQLEDNPDGNLTARQVQFAHVIRSSGVDLLKLLNDILDLAKVESNTVHLEIGVVSLPELRDNMLLTFKPIADAQGLGFSVELDDRLPATIATDPLRLRQVLKNLLSNAFKFTEQGEVSLKLELSADGWSPSRPELARASSVARPRGRRHRDRHQARPAGVRVRGVRAGRRLDRPQVRRNRPGTLDQSQPRRSARRRDRARERGRAGQQLHGLPADRHPSRGTGRCQYGSARVDRLPRHQRRSHGRCRQRRGRVAVPDRNGSPRGR